MSSEDKNFVIGRYKNLYDQFGMDPRSVDWPKGRQQLRFQVFAEIDDLSNRSLLDVGCGFADFYTFMKERGWTGEYTGYDIASFFIEDAKKKHPGLNLEVHDILDSDSKEQHDYVFASGIFNAKLVHEDSARFTERMLRKMFELSRCGIAANFLSTHVDSQKPESFHSDPRWIMDIAASLSRRFVVRHDYFPFEFTVYIYKSQTFDRTMPVFNDFLSRGEILWGQRRGAGS